VAQALGRRTDVRLDQPSQTPRQRLRSDNRVLARMAPHRPRLPAHATPRQALRSTNVIFESGSETEHESGKNVVQAALERETEDDGNYAGGGEQALNGEIENIGDDGESRSQIDCGRENILNELTVSRAPFEDDHGPHQGDQEPGRPKPPGDFQYSCD